MELQIIYESRDLIAVFKPPGIATQTKDVLAKDMVSLVRSYISRREEAGGAFDGAFRTKSETASSPSSEKLSGSADASETEPVHRLDQPASGILVFAKNKEAFRSLSEQFSGHSCDKRYLAIVEGVPGSPDPKTYGKPAGKAEPGNAAGKAEPGNAAGKAEPGETAGKAEQGGAYEETRLIHYLRKETGRGGAKAVVCKASDRGAKRAELKYKITRIFNDPAKALLDIQLLTGRFHQIRAQLSATGHPIVGDLKYGCSEASEAKGIALLCYHLTLTDPGSGEKLELRLSENDAAMVDFLRNYG